MHRIKLFVIYWIIIAAIISLALVIFIPLIYAQTASAGVNGRLTASFSNGYSPRIDISELELLIEQAVSMIEDTIISEDGVNIPIDSYWARQAAHKEFQDVINTAKTVLSEMKIIGEFAQGDTFSMTLGIEDNTGFANMAIRLFIPAGLELTHVEAVGFQEMVVVLPPGHMPGTEAITPIVGPGYAFVTCFGSTNFEVINSDLLVYTFRVVENAGIEETNPITVVFANTNGYSFPIDSEGVALNIMLPRDRNEVLGGVIILPNV